MKPDNRKQKILDWSRTDPRCVTILAEPWRFGILFGPEKVEGDLRCGLLNSLSHSKAGVIPSADRHSFLQYGVRFVGTGGVSAGPLDVHEIDAYEMVELRPGLIPPKRVRYCYSGEQVRLHGRVHVLCRPVKFAARRMLPQEFRWHLRRQWAWGGYFALKNEGYGAFLRDRLLDITEIVNDHRNTDRERGLAAEYLQPVRSELRCPAVSLSRHEMKVLTARDPLFLARPWAKAAPASGRKVAFALSADDALAALLSK